MSFLIGKSRLLMHPLLPLLWGVAVLTGKGGAWLASAAALVIHECGHLTAAKLLSIPIGTIEITPFGGVMTPEGIHRVTPVCRFSFAAAGPVMSLLGCFFSVLLDRWNVPFAWVRQFARANLLLLAVNLLPALPLDGGEMLRAILSARFPAAAVTRALTGVGYAVGVLLGAVSLAAAFRGQVMLFPLFAGLYLIYAVALERRDSTARYVTALIARRQRLELGEILPMEWLAVSADTPARLILPRLSLGKYHVIYVLSRDGMACLDRLDEKTFCEMTLNQPDEPVGSQLKEEHQKSNLS